MREQKNWGETADLKKQLYEERELGKTIQQQQRRNKQKWEERIVRFAQEIEKKDEQIVAL